MYDSLAYHLVIPQQFRFAHKVMTITGYDATAVPFLPHAGYLWVFLLGADWRGAAVLNWAHGILCAVAIVRIASRAGVSSFGPLLAGAIWLTIPLVLLEFSAPLSDFHMTFYVLLAGAHLAGARPADRDRRFAVVGLCCGLAVACKYPAVLAWAPCGLAAALLPGTARLRVVRAAVLGLGIALAFSAVPAKNYLFHGDATYPFLSSWGDYQRILGWYRQRYWIDRTVTGAALLPARLAVQDEKQLGALDLWQSGAILAVFYLLPVLGWLALRSRKTEAGGAARRARVVILGLATWGLAYYLTFQQHLLRDPALDRYVQSTSKGGSPIEHFEELAGMSLAQFDTAWRQYILKLR